MNTHETLQRDKLEYQAVMWMFSCVSLVVGCGSILSVIRDKKKEELRLYLNICILISIQPLASIIYFLNLHIDNQTLSTPSQFRDISQISSPFRKSLVNVFPSLSKSCVFSRSLTWSLIVLLLFSFFISLVLGVMCLKTLIAKQRESTV